jgi:TctA family transporter
MNPINEFTLKKLQKLGPIGYVFKKVDFRKAPLVLQTNLYVIAHKTGD